MSLTLKERMQSENWPTWSKAVGVTRRVATFSPAIRIPEDEKESMGKKDFDYISACLSKPGGRPNSGYPIMREITFGQRRNLAGLNILEAQPGFFELANLLAEQGAKVVGVDIDPSMIQVGRDVFGKNPNITFVNGDVTDLREVFGNKKFDVALSQDSAHHLRTQERLRRFFENMVTFGDQVVVKDFDRNREKTFITWWRMLFTNPGTVGLLGDSLAAAHTLQDVNSAIKGLNLEARSPAPNIRKHGSAELRRVIENDPVPRHLDERFSWIVRTK